MKNKIIENSTEDFLKAIYKKERFDLNTTFCFVYCSEDIEDQIKSFIRITDNYKRYDNLYIIEYNYTSEDKSFKAIQNLFSIINPNDFLTTIALITKIDNSKNINIKINQIINEINHLKSKENNYVEII